LDLTDPLTDAKVCVNEKNALIRIRAIEEMMIFFFMLLLERSIFEFLQTGTLLFGRGRATEELSVFINHFLLSAF